MLQTLFYIPDHLFGAPLFGPLSILSAIWAVTTLFMLGRQVYRQGINGDVLINMGMLGLVGAAICFYLPKLLVPIPDTQNAGLPIRAYGVMVLIGIVCGIWLAVRRARKRGIEVELIFVLAIWLIVGGIVGARLFYVSEYWEKQHFHRTTATGGFDFAATAGAVLNIAQGGLVIYGALIGGGVGGLLFWLFHRKLPMLRIADVIAPSMALGLGIGRIGCFLNGCCYGDVSDVPWSVTFPQDSPPYVRQLETGDLYLSGDYFVHGLAFHARADKAGAKVFAVEEHSAAETAGMKPGETIVQVFEKLPADPMTPVQVFPIAAVPADKPAALQDQAKAAEPDATLGALVRALLSIKEKGAKVVLYTEDRTDPIEWTVAGPSVVPSRSRPVQPTQLYSAIDGVLLCLLLLAFDPFRRRDGEVMALMLTVHPVARFLLESIRTDEPKDWGRSMFGVGMSVSQVLSLLILVVAAVLWAYIMLRMPRLERIEPPPEEFAETEISAE